MTSPLLSFWIVLNIHLKTTHFHGKKSYLKRSFVRCHLLSETFYGHLIYNNLSPKQHSIMLFTILIYFTYWSIFWNREKAPWGQGFLSFFAHYCISWVPRTMFVSSGHSVNIWGILMPMANESSLLPYPYAQNLWVSQFHLGISFLKASLNHPVQLWQSCFSQAQSLHTPRRVLHPQ